MLIVPLAGLAPTGELVFEQLDLFSTAAAATAEAASGGTVASQLPSSALKCRSWTR